MSLLAPLAVSMALLALPASAPANHGVTDLLTPGSSTDSWHAGTFGSRLFISTGEQLAPEDHDAPCPGFDPEWDPPYPCYDAYEKVGNGWRLITTGPTGGNGPYDAYLVGAASSGDRAFFITREQMVAQDTDASYDVYERSGNTTTLVSVDENGANTPRDVNSRGVFEDGNRLLFETDDPLVASDQDTDPYASRDVYQRRDGVLSLISTGPLDDGTASIESLVKSSSDGASVFFISRSRLVSEDLDTQPDIYRRSAGTTTLVSPGGLVTDRIDDEGYQVSADGSAALFGTAARMTASDLDDQWDVYKWRNGTVTLESTGPTDTHAWPACHELSSCFQRLSADGTRSFFFTHEGLTSEDTGGYLDLYERHNGTTKLVTIGPAGGNGPVHADRSFWVSGNGEHVFFWTQESLVSEDTDTGTNPYTLIDLYERFNGTTKLVSTGPNDVPNSRHNWSSYSGVLVSEDGSRAVFHSYASLVAEDNDGGRQDVYERSGGKTTLLSTGPGDDGAGPDGEIYTSGNRDLSEIYLETTQRLVSADSDSYIDAYRKTFHEAPQAASPIRVSLVPVYTQCSIPSNLPNGQHASPFSVGSCLPHKRVSGYARFGPASAGSVTFTVQPGDGHPSNGDQADVAISTRLNDVQTLGGADYVPNPSGPDVAEFSRMRLTDARNNGEQSGTAQEIFFDTPVDCVATADPATGSTCSADTTADAVMPGFAMEGSRTVIQVFRALVFDGGQNGVPDDADDTLLAQQGIYIP